MSIPEYEFDTSLGENSVRVEFDYKPGTPDVKPTLHYSGEPAEGPTVELGDVYLTNVGGDLIFYIDDLMVLTRHPGDFIFLRTSAAECLVEKAIEFMEDAA